MHAAVREGGRGQARRPLQRSARELLIASQIALALVLLTGAGLMLRSLWQLQQVDTGFAADQVLTFETAVPTATYEEGEQIPFYDQLYERHPRAPGCRRGRRRQHSSAQRQLRQPRRADRGAPDAARAGALDSGAIGRARLLRGDGHSRARGSRASTSATANTRRSSSSSARRWPGATGRVAAPVGQRITFNSGIPQDQQQEVGGPGSREVVGVVGDVKHLGLDEDEVPMFYTPQAQQPSYHTMALVVRAPATRRR